MNLPSGVRPCNAAFAPDDEMETGRFSSSLVSSILMRDNPVLRSSEKDGKVDAKRAKRVTTNAKCELNADVAAPATAQSVGSDSCEGGASAVKGPWSADEDALLRNLVFDHGAKKWSTIATHLPGRIGKQVARSASSLPCTTHAQPRFYPSARSSQIHPADPCA